MMATLILFFQKITSAIYNAVFGKYFDGLSLYISDGNNAEKFCLTQAI